MGNLRARGRIASLSFQPEDWELELGVPCEDCGQFCKQQCYIWDKVYKLVEKLNFNYPNNWAILSSEEFSKRLDLTITCHTNDD